MFFSKRPLRTGGGAGIVVMVCCALLWSSNAAIAENLRDTQPSSQPIRIAKTVAEKDKVYSPDRKLYAYIETSKQTVAAGNGDVPADVIWLGSASEAPRPLFKRAAKYKTNKPIGEISLGGIGDLCFASDNSELYFINAAYAVSGIVLAINLKTNKIRDVIDANTLEISRKGPWKGNLLVQRHKYNDQGAYDAECVATPQGKELKELRRVDFN